MVCPIRVNRIQNIWHVTASQCGSYKLSVRTIECHQTSIIWKFSEVALIISKRRDINLLAVCYVCLYTPDPFHKIITRPRLTRHAQIVHILTEDQHFVV